MMKQIKSVDELIKLKEAALNKIKERQIGNKTTIVVNMGTCGIAAGAREVMMAIIDEIEKRNISNVIITQAGCAGLCEHEPMLAVIRPDKSQVIYGHLDKEKARRIVIEHVIHDKVVEECALAQQA
ncbi:(2Fe-2S) ferredoxin domain-containing protein [Pelotomaculum isophthalicicum JI]|uniref:(2Fe-2S) ferredoxin domain-containing protein n=1 Tax=Pelotomaculum isophthalicicum JI TaxID=947010 RepID=A0A9X4GZ80_9FIRM|nr:(2Fe-2S) ferredoxin domain-containing protein [Pelotomaculum isophthalicicum]MDF9408452.1 (2Fe-2S) ferredoxin domain-containing protein [Pelotomaculum isophthalicicum JI]